MKTVWLIGSAAALAIGAAATVGQVGRSALPALDAAPAWAGGRPDVALCESFIRQGVPPAAVYRRTDATRTDGASGTLAEFDQAAGVRVPKPRRKSSGDALVDESDHLDAVMAELEHDRAVGRPVALRTVAIGYTVDGEAQRQTCAFRLVDGQMEDPEALRLRAERRADRSSTDAVRASVGLTAPRRSASRFDCCL